MEFDYTRYSVLSCYETINETINETNSYSRISAIYSIGNLGKGK